MATSSSASAIKDDPIYQILTNTGSGDPFLKLKEKYYTMSGVLKSTNVTDSGPDRGTFERMTINRDMIIAVFSSTEVQSVFAEIATTTTKITDANNTLSAELDRMKLALDAVIGGTASPDAVNESLRNVLRTLQNVLYMFFEYRTAEDTDTEGVEMRNNILKTISELTSTSELFGYVYVKPEQGPIFGLRPTDQPSQEQRQEFVKQFQEQQQMRHEELYGKPQVNPSREQTLDNVKAMFNEMNLTTGAPSKQIDLNGNETDALVYAGAIAGANDADKLDPARFNVGLQPGKSMVVTNENLPAVNTFLQQSGFPVLTQYQADYMINNPRYLRIRVNQNDKQTKGIHRSLLNAVVFHADGASMSATSAAKRPTWIKLLGKTAQKYVKGVYDIVENYIITRMKDVKITDEQKRVMYTDPKQALVASYPVYIGALGAFGFEAAAGWNVVPSETTISALGDVNGRVARAVEKETRPEMKQLVAQNITNLFGTGNIKDERRQATGFLSAAKNMLTKSSHHYLIDKSGEDILDRNKNGVSGDAVVDLIARKTTTQSRFVTTAEGKQNLTSGGLRPQLVKGKYVCLYGIDPGLRDYPKANTLVVKKGYRKCIVGPINNIPNKQMDNADFAFAANKYETETAGTIKNIISTPVDRAHNMAANFANGLLTVSKLSSESGLLADFYLRNQFRNADATSLFITALACAVTYRLVQTKQLTDVHFPGGILVAKSAQLKYTEKQIRLAGVLDEQNNPVFRTVRVAENGGVMTYNAMNKRAGILFKNAKIQFPESNVAGSLNWRRAVMAHLVSYCIICNNNPSVFPSTSRELARVRDLAYTLLTDANGGKMSSKDATFVYREGPKQVAMLANSMNYVGANTVEDVITALGSDLGNTRISGAIQQVSFKDGNRITLEDKNDSTQSVAVDAAKTAVATATNVADEAKKQAEVAAATSQQIASTPGATDAEKQAAAEAAQTAAAEAEAARKAEAEAQRLLDEAEKVKKDEEASKAAAARRAKLAEQGAQDAAGGAAKVAKQGEANMDRAPKRSLRTTYPTISVVQGTPGKKVIEGYKDSDGVQHYVMKKQKRYVEAEMDVNGNLTPVTNSDGDYLYRS